MSHRLVETAADYGLFRRCDYPPFPGVTQIGPLCSWDRGKDIVRPSRVLRAGTDLEKWVRRNVLHGQGATCLKENSHVPR